MSVADRIKEGIAKAKLEISAEKLVERETLEKFDRFVKFITSEVDGIRFRHPLNDVDMVCRVSRAAHGHEYAVRVKDVKGEALVEWKVADITNGSKERVLWMVDIVDLGTHHKFADGSTECWIKDESDPRIEELKQFIEDAVVKIASYTGG